MGSLTKELILQVDDKGVESVEVPEWGGTVNIRVFSALERDKLAAQLGGVGGKDMMSALVARYGICDEQGKPLFGDEDVLRLGNKSSIAMTRVVDRIIALNKMGPKDIDGEVKN